MTKAIYSNMRKAWIPIYRFSEDSNVWHFVNVFDPATNRPDTLYLACDEGLALAIAAQSRDIAIQLGVRS